MCIEPGVLSPSFAPVAICIPLLLRPYVSFRGFCIPVACLIFRCPFHDHSLQEQRCRQHQGPRRGTPESPSSRETFSRVARLFRFCCRVRNSSLLYSAFLMLACCSSGGKEDRFLHFLASVWLLCDEADDALETVNPTDSSTWQAATGNSKRGGPLAEPSLAPEEKGYDPHGELLSSVSDGEGGLPAATVPAEGEAPSVRRSKGGERSFRRLLSGAALSRSTTKLPFSWKRDAFSASPGGTPSRTLEQPSLQGTSGISETAGTHCALLAVSRCQCVAYIRGFVASLLPPLLWSFLSRTLLPPAAQSLPHLLVPALEEAKRSGLLQEWQAACGEASSLERQACFSTKCAPDGRDEEEGGTSRESFFQRLRERITQLETTDAAVQLRESFGLEDLLLLFAGSSEGGNRWGSTSQRRHNKRRSMGSSVAVSAVLPESLRLDGRQQGASESDANTLLRFLPSFAGGSLCASLLSTQQQRSRRLEAFLGHAADATEASEEHAMRQQLEESGTLLTAFSDGEAAAPARYREYLIMQREALPDAPFLTTDGLQSLCERVLACFCCYAGACGGLEESVAVAATTAGEVVTSEPISAVGGGPHASCKVLGVSDSAVAAEAAQGALWAQQQLLLHPDGHAALLLAGLAAAIAEPQGFLPLPLEVLLPQPLRLLLEQQQQRERRGQPQGSERGPLELDAWAARLVDGALLPLDCACGGSVRKGAFDAMEKAHCLNAAAASRVSVELLLNLEVDPMKTGRAHLPVGECLMMQLCKTLGSLMHANRPVSSVSEPSWTLPLGGIESLANGVAETVQQWEGQVNCAMAQVIAIEQHVSTLLQRAHAAAAASGGGLERVASAGDDRASAPGLPACGQVLLDPEARQQQLCLLLLLHQSQHFGCNCCCCSFTDTMDCPLVAHLVSLAAAECHGTPRSRRILPRQGEAPPQPTPAVGSSSSPPALPASLDDSPCIRQAADTPSDTDAKGDNHGGGTEMPLWPLIRQRLVLHRLELAARQCMLRSERDPLLRSYWAFVALGAIS
ncbi:hypothetical protein cyc_04886 [Cyclospora cayetanensis]|uniref:Uncharacterized protein n=1 Tax=Cyclospora cayetanensis TaxID=88456 RepID=A0A1D3CU79_9EIME|nr:hypothetical protein cyc_04886 [Cyclospora cayetanensis]